IIPASQTFSSGVYSASLTGGGSNRLTAYAAFSSQAIQNLYVLAIKMLDANGNKMLVTPTDLVHGSSLALPVLTLLNSAFYPSTVSMKAGGGASGADTAVGANYAENVLKGLYNPVMSRFLPATAYGIMQGGKGLIFQRRKP